MTSIFLDEAMMSVKTSGDRRLTSPSDSVVVPVRRIYEKITEYVGQIRHVFISKTCPCNI